MTDSRPRRESHLVLVEGRRSFLNVTNGLDQLNALNEFANTIKTDIKS